MKFLLTTALLISSSSYAGNIRVPKEMPTIVDAINVASDGDTILVSPGVYNETINLRGKAITVEIGRAHV